MSLNSRFFVAFFVAFQASLMIAVPHLSVAQTDTSDSSWLERRIIFNRDIRPILSDKCFQCHGPDENARDVELRFDRKESVFADLGGYVAITPGDIVASEMITRILEEDSDLKMPPEDANDPLTEPEIELLKTWVEEGAQWDEFWAYVPPVKHPLREIDGFEANAGEAKKNWIDQMVLARLQDNGLTPSPRADRATLVRRLYLDLIGLPPTPEQVDAYLSDESEEAYDKVVDALLASEHFGERLAMYWLDLVRFADTVGYHGDQDHRITPYRDWVIQSFNNNLPFDQFTCYQLAGDLLPDVTLDQKIASGYNRLLQTTHEGGLQPKEYSAIYAADRVRNVSIVWMGATVGCAQCHDHKYDPYTTKDFYSLAAFFADIDDEKHFKSGTNALPTKRDPEHLVISDENRVELDRLQGLVSAKESQLNVLRKEKETSEKRKTKEGSKDVNEGNGSGDSAVEPDQISSQIKAAEEEFEQIKKEARVVESRGTWTMITKALETPRTVRVLARGNWMDESGEVVLPAIPEFLGAIETNTAESNSRATRLDLANWLTDGNSDCGKMTARVFANRMWYLYMGVGISKSLDDFGGQGEVPAFPELLDNLAMEFASNWDIKRLIRLIVASETYQQSSLETDWIRETDPYNQMFARQSRFRLPAETIRDNALAISGLLNVEQVGGGSVKPYQPAGYYRNLNFPVRKYAHHIDSRQWRRGVYVHWQRMFLHPSLKSFDAPSREECTCERPRSNTPLAALSLLNDPCFVEAARVLAAKIMTEAESDDIGSRLEFAFRRAVARVPGAEEKAVLIELLKINLAEFEQDPEAANKLIRTGQAPVAELLDPVELAAWTSVARAILNMSETISRD